MGLVDSLLGIGSAGDAGPAQATPPPPQDNGQTAFNFFVGQGLAPHQAAGVVGNLQGESGQGLNPNAVNPGDGRDGSDSIGIGQWNGTRAQALKDYAASKGTSWNDLNTQLEFLHSELKGPESKAYTGLTAAKTPEEAGQAMLAYERPKDWNKPGAHPERAQYAARAYSAYGGGNPAVPAPVAQVTPMALSASPPMAAPQIAAPFFPQPQLAPQQAGSEQAALQVPDITPPQIHYAPRRPVNLAALRNAFSAPTFKG